MWGILVGDVIGSVYRTKPVLHKRFEIFSDSASFTECSVAATAICRCLLDGDGTPLEPSAALESIDALCGRYRAVLGRASRDVAEHSALRAVQALSCGWVSESAESLQALASSAADWPDQPEDLLHDARAGAQIAALTVFRAGRFRGGDPLPTFESAGSFPRESPTAVRHMYTEPSPLPDAPFNRNREVRFAIAREIEDRYNIDLGMTWNDLVFGYEYSGYCVDTVRDALICFFDSIDFEDAVRNAVALGTGSSALPAIAGGIAEAYYGVPAELKAYATSHLDREIVDTAVAFERRFWTR